MIQLEDASTIASLTENLTQQAPALGTFAIVIGMLVRHFLLHLKTTAKEHSEAMVSVVKLTSEALTKNTEAIFEHSRMVGATLSTLNAIAKP